MHRLLKLNNEQLCRIQSVCFNNRSFKNVDQACYLCNNLICFSKGSSRFQSTNVSPNLKQKKPKKKRSKCPRKYAELLVVANNTTVEQKTTIKKLNPNDLKKFITTSFNLDELYKLKSIPNDKRIVEEHTYNNLTVIEHAPSVIDSEINVLEKLTEATSDVLLNDQEFEKPIESPSVVPDIEEIPVTSFIRSETSSHFHPETTEEDHEITEIEEPHDPKLDKQSIELAARQEIISKTLSAYIEVCNVLKAPQRGLNALHFHRARVRRTVDKFIPPLKDVKVYNALLKGFAAKGDFPKIQEVLKYVKEEDVNLDVHSFAAIFECLGRVNADNSHAKWIKIFTKEANKNEITFDTIMNEAIFMNDQREMILKAVGIFDRDYSAKYTFPKLQYDNHLVDRLNCDEQLKVQGAKSERSGGVFKKVKWEEMVNKQIKLETEGFITVKSVETKGKPSEEILRYREVFEEHIKTWETAAHEAFARDLATLSAQRNALNLEPYMRCIPAKDFVRIIVEEAKKIAQGSETYSPTVYMLNKELGNKVYARYKVLLKQKTGVLKKTTEIHNRYCKDYGASHGELDVLPLADVKINPRQKWQQTEHSLKYKGASHTLDHHEWVPTVLQNIGKFLYHIVMHDLKINVNSMRANSKHKNYLPAFYTVFRNQGRLVKEEVKPHPILCKLYRASQPEELTFPAYEVPMLCPPVPWVSVHTGGYLIAPCDMVRLPTQAATQKQRLNDADPVSVYPSMDSLNQLAAVPWKVNTKVLDVILRVFRCGGSSKLDVPEPPSSLPAPENATAEIDKLQRYNLFKQKLQYRRKKAEMYSLWCDCLYRLSLANHFRDKVFWLPHNMDFRGRVYPVPPHLNHLGSDLARSMLVFAEPRPLSDKGLDWLKLHLINLTGLMKHDSLDERLRYANRIIDKILDSADDPLGGQRWWAESDEPWQTLACCMEIAAAMRSPDPTMFKSHFPVHQDGSCNGLQHYAALGRDGAGAHSVNLTASPVPQDVYSAVAVLVERQRRDDAEKGLQIAKVLEGFVKRKVIKQTVMTTVYGVTRFGARLQIAKQLKDIDNFPKEHVWAASSYLTGRTFDSLRTMFTSTREIQDWFTECARLISSVCGQNVEWITPLGLPVVQPYSRYKKMTTGAFEYFQMDKYEKPNTMKQKNAFPPNFIHSLDSSHMMLTSLNCERAGITFVSVHDCYWTHPSTVHIMNKICREQFVALHSEPILEDLSVFLSQKYSYSDTEFTDDGSSVDLTKRKLNKILRQLPKTGKFDIREVLNSIYFFS